jgi:hypothetical protein
VKLATECVCTLQESRALRWTVLGVEGIAWVIALGASRLQASRATALVDVGSAEQLADTVSVLAAGMEGGGFIDAGTAFYEELRVEVGGEEKVLRVPCSMPAGPVAPSDAQLWQLQPLLKAHKAALAAQKECLDAAGLMETFEPLRVRSWCGSCRAFVRAGLTSRTRCWSRCFRVYMRRGECKRCRKTCAG